jgi:hypothetical protein
VRKLVVELEAGGFAAAHPTFIDIRASPFVSLPHVTPYVSRHVPAAPAWGVSAVSVVALLARRFGGALTFERFAANAALARQNSELFALARGNSALFSLTREVGARKSLAPGDRLTDSTIIATWGLCARGRVRIR